MFFRNQPLGCTATIVYQMYREAGVEVDRTIAGLLCSAIISDTLLFRSPTCTEVDKKAATELAVIAGIQLETYAGEMFAAGSNLKSKTDEDIFYQYLMNYRGKVSFGVGQISSMNVQELDTLKTRLIPYIQQAHKEQRGMDMIFFMLTNILDESTILICEGSGARKSDYERVSY